MVQLPGADAAITSRVRAIIAEQGVLEFRLTANTDEFDADRLRELAGARDRGDPPPPGYHWYKIRDEEDWELVADELLFDGTDLIREAVKVLPDPQQLGSHIITFQFKARSPAALKLAEVSREWVAPGETAARRRMAVILNDRRDHSGAILQQEGTYLPHGALYSAPKFQGEIPEGDGQISGSFTNEEARQLRTVLRSGALPGILTLQREDHVGPTLGQDSIRKGMLACLVGLGLTFLFMGVTYTWAGLAADLALFLNLSLVVATMATLHSPLTLPGIAGIVLTIGMAVDANVLVFERMREELAAGRSIESATDLGYQKALSAIIDSNLTTLFTGIILYAFGSGPVKGFAVTLCLGIGFSMFTVLFVTRTLMAAYAAATGATTLRMVRWIGVLDWKFLDSRKAYYAFSAILLTACLAAVRHRGWGMLGIDFQGGTTVQVRLREPVRHDAFRTRVGEALEASTIRDRSPRIQPYQEGGVAADAARSFSIFVRDQEASSLDDLEMAVRGAFENDLAPAPFGPVSTTAARAQVTAVVRGGVPTQEIVEALAARGIAAAIVEAVEGTGGEPPRLRVDAPGAAPDALETAVLEVLGDRLVRRGWRVVSEEGPARVCEARFRTAPTDAEAVRKILLEAFPRLRDVVVTASDAGPGGPWRVSYASDRPVAIESTLNASFGLLGPFEETRSTTAGLSFEARLHHALPAEEIGRRLGRTSLTLDGEARTDGGIQILRLKATGEGPEAAQQEARKAFEQELSDPVPARATRSKQVSGEMNLDAVKAIAASLVVILVYITFRFEFRYGLAAALALVHDVIVTLGVLALHPDAVVDLPVVAALLTIIGYSLNDTIVIFDRVRENITLSGHADLAGTINRSIGQTMGRTVLTALTTLLTVTSLLVFGGDATFSFALAMTAGVVAGTYSTACIACPLVLRRGERT